MNSLPRLRSLLGSSRYLTRSYSVSARYAEYELLRVTCPFPHVLHVQLNRPDKRNALTRESFRELTDVFTQITEDTDARAVVLSGSGKTFCAGIDYLDLMETIGAGIGAGPEETPAGTRDDIAGLSKLIRQMIGQLQVPFSAMANCPKPVIAAIHSGCIGGAIDMISAVDVRYACADAYFSIREVALGVAADLGTLQRLPKMAGNDSLVRELAFTGRDLPAIEAKEFGLISRLYDTPQATIDGALETAQAIASKSPVAVQGSKIALNHSRDHSTADGLEFMQIWNMAMLQSEDLITATVALATRQESPEFADL